MINANQIVRLAELQEYRQLLGRVLLNGRCPSQLVRAALDQPDVVAPAALGLALQRLCELTYRPSPDAHRLAQQLLQMQGTSGLFEPSPFPSDPPRLAATACAVRGLMMLAQQCRDTGSNPDVASNAMDAAIHRAFTALAAEHNRGNVEAAAVDWAIVLWQLGDSEQFRQVISVEALLVQLTDTAGEQILDDELCRYAQAMAA